MAVDAAPTKYRGARVPHVFLIAAICVSGFNLASAQSASESAERQDGESAFGADAFALIEAGLRREERAKGDVEITTPVMLSANVSVLDFGAIEVGFQTSTMIVLSNAGLESVSGTLETDTPFAVDPAAFTLAPEESSEIQVRFLPEARESYEANLAILVEEELQLELPLTGQGVAPVLSRAPGTIDFRTVRVGDALVRRVRIENTGELMLLGDASVGGAFSILNGETYSLSADASTFLDIEFRPGRSGTHAARLQFSGDPDAAMSVELVGRGAEAVGQIRGQIVDAQSGNPLGCAAIALTGDDGTQSVSVSDANGVFVTEAIARQIYEAKLTGAGYEDTTQTIALNAGFLERRFELQTRLTREVVRGVVGDAVGGALLGGVRIAVFQNNVEVDFAYTCANGKYELRISSGTSPIGFAIAAPGYEGGELTMTVAPPFDGPVNFVLMPDGFPGVDIGGRVQQQGNETAISMASVSARSRGISRTVFSRQDGIFALPAIAEGEYSIRVSAAEHLAADDVMVRAFQGEDGSDVAVRLTPGEDSVLAPDPGEGQGEAGGCASSIGTRARFQAGWADFILIAVAGILMSTRRRNSFATLKCARRAVFQDVPSRPTCRKGPDGR